MDNINLIEGFITKDTYWQPTATATRYCEALLWVDSNFSSLNLHLKGSFEILNGVRVTNDLAAASRLFAYRKNLLHYLNGIG